MMCGSLVKCNADRLYGLVWTLLEMRFGERVIEDPVEKCGVLYTLLT
jgi:hypothetical protein